MYYLWPFLCVCNDNKIMLVFIVVIWLSEAPLEVPIKRHFSKSRGFLTQWGENNFWSSNFELIHLFFHKKLPSLFWDINTFASCVHRRILFEFRTSHNPLLTLCRFLKFSFPCTHDIYHVVHQWCSNTSKVVLRQKRTKLMVFQALQQVTKQ